MIGESSLLIPRNYRYIALLGILREVKETIRVVSPGTEFMTQLPEESRLYYLNG